MCGVVTTGADVMTYEDAVALMQENERRPIGERRQLLCRFHLLAASPQARVRLAFQALEEAQERKKTSC